MQNERPYTLDRLVRLGMTGAVIWGLVWLLGYLSDVLIPFAAALVLAYMLNPLTNWLENLVKSRLAAVLLTLGLLTAAGVLAVWLVAPLIGGELGRMARLVHDVATNSELAQQAARQLPASLWPAIQDLIQRPEIQELLKSSDTWSLLATVARKLLPSLWGLVAQVGGFIAGLTGLLLVALYLFFLMLDLGEVSRGWREAIPPSQRERIVELVEDFTTALRRYFRAQAGVAAIVGVLFAVGFSVIGLPLGILLGLFMGLLNMVPYLQILGAIPAFLLAVLAALEQGGSIWQMLGLTAGVFAAVQIIQDGFLTPRIVGRTMSLSPAFLLLSLSVWGKLLGFLGLLMAIPFTCLAWAWYQRFVIHAGEEAPQAPGS